MENKKEVSILELFDEDEIVEKSDGNYKTECPDCGLQGNRTKGFILFPENNHAYCHESQKTFNLLEVIALKLKVIKCIEGREPKEKGSVIKGDLFKETLDIVKEEYGKDFYHRLLKTLKIKKNIEIPGDNRLISDFCDDLSKRFKDEEIMFYRSQTRNIIEIGTIKQPDGKKIDNGFIELKPNRFITMLERYFSPWTWKKTKEGTSYKIKKSINSSIAKTVLDSYNLQDNLPVIDRIFPVQIPVIYNNKLTFPKEGYDVRFGSWLSYNAPKITEPNLSLDKAKKILNTIYSEFCFKDEQDKVNAISGLLTPYLRGIFKSFNTRTPFFCYMANRERAGKDYCAGITGIVYEGSAVEESPIATTDKHNNTNEELRKKVTSAMIQGRKRFHSSNNKGLINNAVLESIITSEKHSDRILGKNDIVSMDNEIDFSMSGNIGTMLSPDLANRSIFVNLFLEIEDANKRKFDNPNLHHWIKDNRNLIVSALYTLVRNWFNKGCPLGKHPFTSFPEWAQVCGGIMESAGYGNPCKKSENTFSVSLDSETEDMKQLFEICFENNPNNWMKKKEIKEIILDYDENIMSGIDFETKSGQTKFGTKIDKFVGRVLSNIKMLVENENERSSRRKYKFVKQEKNYENESKSSHNPEKLVTLVTLGNLGCTPANSSAKAKYKGVVQTLPKDTKVTKSQNDKKTTKKPKSDREVQFWEAKECENIKLNCTKKEIEEFLKNNPKIDYKQIYEKFGTGSIKFMKEVQNEMS